MSDLAAGAAATVRLRSTRGRWVLAVSVLGSGMAFLDATIVNVALPRIGKDLGASTSELQWILSAYLLTLASLILLGGSLGDRYGRRRVFVLGTAFFSAASLACALAPSAQALIGARLLQGIGGALLTPGSLAMIESTFVREDRSRAIGAWSGMTGVATALGPLLGGYLIGAVSWRAAFIINVPLGAVVIGAARRVPESRDPQAGGRIDARGVALAALALGASTYALIEGPQGGAAPVVAIAGTVAVVASVAFVLAERDSARPMLPFEVFTRQFAAANLVTFVVYAALGGMFFLFVAFLQIALGYSPLAAGAASLPVTVLMLLFSPASGSLAQRVGPRAQLTLGPLVIACGMVLMSQLGRGSAYLTGVLPTVLVFGLGLTLVVSPVTATALAAAGERHAGIASGVNNAVARLAGLLAVALLPLIAGLTGDRFYRASAMTHGFQVAMLACAVLAAVGGVLAFMIIDNDVLTGDAAGAGPGEQATSTRDLSCAVAGTPLRAVSDGAPVGRRE